MTIKVSRFDKHVITSRQFEKNGFLGLTPLVDPGFGANRCFANSAAKIIISRQSSETIKHRLA